MKGQAVYTSEEHWYDGISIADHRAFAQVYASHFNRLVKVALPYAACEDEAREIVQTVFLKLWESPPVMINPGALFTYLHRVVINHSINHIRRAQMIQRHHTRMAADMTTVVHPAMNESTDTQLHQLQKAIEELPEQCRRIFKMHRFENMTYREVATAVGVAEKTVENHVMYALKKLRLKLRRTSPAGE